MFYTKRGILFFLIHLLIHNVLMQDIEIKAFVGDTVILPCSIKTTEAGGDRFWLYGFEEKAVVDIIAGEEVVKDQSPEYRGRVKTFTLEIPKGNFSITLSNVTLLDSGIYTCHPEPVQRVNLRVTEGYGYKNGDLRRASSVFLLGICLLYSLDY